MDTARPVLPVDLLRWRRFCGFSVLFLPFLSLAFLFLWIEVHCHGYHMHDVPFAGDDAAFGLDITTFLLRCPLCESNTCEGSCIEHKPHIAAKSINNDMA